MKLASTTVVLTTLSAAGLAAAQPAASPTQTVLPNILSTQLGGQIDARLDYTSVDEPIFDDLTFLSLVLRGQYVTPQGLGGYVSLPLGYTSGNGDSETSIGNLELGGLFVINNKPDLDFYLRGGVALNTADDDGTLLVPLATIVPRLTDALTTGFDSNWLRAAGGLRLTSGVIALGGHLGIDVATDSQDDDAILTLAGSVGIVMPTFGLSAGLALLQDIGDDTGDDNTVGFNLVADFAASPSARVYGALGLNLEDEFDGFSLGAGVRVGF
jgi:hypothetical protein